MPSKVRIGDCVALLHRNLRLPPPGLDHQRKSVLRAWRPLSFNKHIRWDQDHRSQAGGATRWCHVRLDVERPRRCQRVEHEPPRSWLPLRRGYRTNLQPREQCRTNRQSPLVSYGRLQVSPFSISDLLSPPKSLFLIFLSIFFREMFEKTLVTVWSAPNYCYRCGNVAAILELDENLHKSYKIFEAAP